MQIVVEHQHAYIYKFGESFDVYVASTPICMMGNSMIVGLFTTILGLHMDTGFGNYTAKNVMECTQPPQNALNCCKFPFFIFGNELGNDELAVLWIKESRRPSFLQSRVNVYINLIAHDRTN